METKTIPVVTSPLLLRPTASARDVTAFPMDFPVLADIRGLPLDILKKSWPEIPWDDDNQLQARWDYCQVYQVSDVFLGTDGVLFTKDHFYLPPYDLWLTTLEVLQKHLQNDLVFNIRKQTVTFPSAEFPSCFRWRPSLQLPFATSPRGHPRFRWSPNRSPRADLEPFVERHRRVISLIHPECGMYFHWLIEAQSRLLLVLDVLRREPAVRLLVDDQGYGGCYRNRWTSSFLARAGIPEERLIHYDPRKIYLIEDLILPHPFVSPYIPRSVLHGLRNWWVPRSASLHLALSRLTFLHTTTFSFLRPAHAIGSPAPAAQRRLVILMRRGTEADRELPPEERDVRRVSNHGALLEALRAATALRNGRHTAAGPAPAACATASVGPGQEQQRDDQPPAAAPDGGLTDAGHRDPPCQHPPPLEVVEFTSVSLPTAAHAVDLFSRAALVLGPHGAGFANIVFAPARCRVLEIFPIPREQRKIGCRPCFWSLALTMEQQYQAFPVMFEDTDEQGWSAWDVPEFEVPVADVVKTAIEMLDHE
ncbi:hypothetical protein PAPYR_2990 [Paratrimastix pyriformis]|uniref:Uncharacterized protein n=1 Tax=Paratrimastix pyriformis TaxID=342808 RepID=A0ABQ8UNJ0_9EUKA|nr:hypothetical protein PAPYR_2990 [Paratrimastix pyriformis]